MSDLNLELRIREEVDEVREKVSKRHFEAWGYQLYAQVKEMYEVFKKIERPTFNITEGEINFLEKKFIPAVMKARMVLSDTTDDNPVLLTELASYQAGAEAYLTTCRVINTAS